MKSGDPDEDHPERCASVAWADAQRFEDVPLSLLVASDKMLAQTDQPMGIGEVAVDRERPLALGDALEGAVAVFAPTPVRRGRSRSPASI